MRDKACLAQRAAAAAAAAKPFAISACALSGYTCIPAAMSVSDNPVEGPQRRRCMRWARARLAQRAERQRLQQRQRGADAAAHERHLGRRQQPRRQAAGRARRAPHAAAPDAQQRAGCRTSNLCILVAPLPGPACPQDALLEACACAHQRQGVSNVQQPKPSHLGQLEQSKLS